MLAGPAPVAMMTVGIKAMDVVVEVVVALVDPQAVVSQEAHKSRIFNLDLKILCSLIISGLA